MGKTKRLLKDFLFESDVPDSEKASSPATPPATAAFQVQTFTVSPASASAFAVTDPEIKARLETLVAATPNQRSLTEFVKTLTSLVSIIPDEQQRYRAALAAVAASGHSKAQILQAVGIILDALDTHLREFRTAAPQEINEKVGACQAELDRADEVLKVRKAEWTRLQDEISRLEADRGIKAAAIDVERRRVEGKVNRFETTFGVVRRGYQAEQDKIARYGEGAN